MKKLFIGGSILCTSSLLAQQHPNIVWIVADDMRASTLELLDIEQVKTPYLNQLAEDCTVFTNGHIMGGSSGAVSMPSRAMLMTGKYLYKLEKQGEYIPESHITIGEVFRQAGYQTFHTGKWHNGEAGFNRCFSSGKDIFFGGMADHWNVPLWSYKPDGNYQYHSRPQIADPFHNNTVKLEVGEYAYSGKHSTDIFTDTAIDFITSRSENDSPFFLSVCYMSPHDPRSMPDEYMDMYKDTDIQLPPNFMLQHPFDNGQLIIRDEQLAATPREPQEIKKHITEYNAMISHLDRRVGDIIEALKKSGSYENTIIVFMADNGLAVGQHGLMGKQSVYKHSVNVPVLIKQAGPTPKKEINDKLFYLIDLYPTMCEMAGLNTPSSVDGISILPVIKENSVVRPYLFFSYLDLQRGITDGEWKLIDYDVKGVRTTQLFNIKNDPFETTDLSNDKKQAKRIRQLRDQLKKERQVAGDDTAFWQL